MTHEEILRETATSPYIPRVIQVACKAGADALALVRELERTYPECDCHSLCAECRKATKKGVTPVAHHADCRLAALVKP